MENQREIELQLNRLVQSEEFKNSHRLQALLSYLVTQTLNGNAHLLKGYTIGVDVFERSADFDTNNDPIVRVQAGKLRKKLEHYYLTEGLGDPVRIALPKGTYVPVMESVQAERAVQLPDVPESETKPVKMAIFPFQMLRKEDENYFSAGLTEEISTLLTRYSDITIVGRHALEHFNNVDQSLLLLHQDYGIEYVLTGHILTAADHFRLNLQLIDVQTNATVWAESFSAKMSAASLFAVQEDIAEKVLARVALSYGAINRHRTRQALRKPPKNLTHYEWVLRAYEYIENPTISKHALVRSGLEQTVAKNPDYADAWIMLAWLYGDEYRFAFNRRSEGSALDIALDAATRATTLDPENCRAFQQLAIVHYCRKEIGKFQQAADTALRINSKDAYTLADLGTLYCLIGDWTQGLTMVDKAISLNPLHPDWYFIAKVLHAFINRQYNDALVLALKFRATQFYLFHFFLTLIYIELGREAEAELALNDLLHVYPGFQNQVEENLARIFLDGSLRDALLASWLKISTAFKL